MRIRGEGPTILKIADIVYGRSKREKGCRWRVNTDKEALLPRMTAEKKKEGEGDGTDMFYSWRKEHHKPEESKVKIRVKFIIIK